MSGDVLAAWIDALGWSLVHFLWQGVLIGFAFAAVRSLLPRERSGARYASGLAALALLALSPVLTLWQLRPTASAVPVPSPLGGVEGAPLAVDAGAGVATILVALWLAGVGIMLVRTFHQWRILHRVVSHLAERHAEMEAMLERVMTRFGKAMVVRVLVSRDIATPMLVGWIRPVILLPAAVVAGFPRHQLELVLAHELGHLRRCDPWVNLAQIVVETLLFYHPVVHWISKEVRHEREVCCDNLVLRVTGSAPREYARTLAALADPRTPVRVGVAAAGGALLDRVRRIVGLPAADGRRAHSGPWLCLVAALGTLAISAPLLQRMPDVVEVDPVRWTLPGSQPDAMRPIVVDVDMPLRWHVTAPVGSVPPATPAVAAKVASVPAAAAADMVVSMPEMAVVPEFALAPSTMAVAGVDVGTFGHTPGLVAPSRVDVRETLAVPLLVKRLDPVYAGAPRTRGPVKFEFSITTDGAVRDIVVVSGDALGGFTLAARRALRQWRFEPVRAAETRRAERYSQEFELVDDEAVLAVISEGSVCPRSLGSRVCRFGQEVGADGLETAKAQAGARVIVSATQRVGDDRS